MQSLHSVLLQGVLSKRRHLLGMFPWLRCQPTHEPVRVLQRSEVRGLHQQRQLLSDLPSGVLSRHGSLRVGSLQHLLLPELHP